MVESKDGLGRSTWFAFDELGNLVERVDGAGERLRMEHDASGRVVRRTSAGSGSAAPIDDRYRFDGFGRMVLARNAHTTLTFGYDALDRALQVTDSASGTAQLRYDADGRTVEMRKCIAVWLLALAAILSSTPQAATLDQARSSAIAWLESHQNSDGSWGSGERRPLVTAEALLALAKADRASGAPALRAKSWLLNQKPVSLDFRARAVRALKASGVDVSREAADLDAMGYVASPAPCLLVPLGGWGPTSEAAVTSYDTALVLSAIKAAGSDPNCRALKLGTLNYLQRTDRGWSGDRVPVVPGEESDRTITAEIVRATALFNLGDPGTWAQNFISTSPTGDPAGSPVTAQTDTLEIASRLAALHAVNRQDGGLETELLNDARLTAAGVWSDTDAFVNAIGLLAVTTKPNTSYPPSCANDSDCDTHVDAVDAFPHDPGEKADSDGDGIGDVADSDRDGDGYCDPNESGGCSGTDMFADDPTEHADSDGDAIGDNDEVDADDDGWSASEETDAGTDPTLEDTDGDGASDSQDPCPLAPSVLDADGDGVCPPLDGCPLQPSAVDLRDLDDDDVCDGADGDDDGDSYPDSLELAAGSDPRDLASIPLDLAAADPTGDFDRDGLLNSQELVTSPYFADTDSDGATDSYELGIADPTNPVVASSQPSPKIAVFSSASTAPPDTAGQPYQPGLASTGGGLRATVTGGQSTPVALPGSPQAASAASGIWVLAGFQPQTMLGRDLDGDGLSGVDEAELRTSGTNVDTDGDLFVDGAGAVVVMSRLPGGWDLEPDGTVDGEADFDTDPADAFDHPGMAGDVAPLGHPDGQLDAADVLVEYRIIRDPSIVVPLAPQNEAITLKAADGNEDERIDAGDLQRVLNTIRSELP
jgi:YD repeat-containing protein